MIDGIQISTSDLFDAANKITDLNSKMDADLAQIKAQIKALRDTWQSDSANEVEEKINSLAPRFEQFRDIVDRYKSFLTTTANNYESTEFTNRTDAANRLNEKFR